MIVTVDGDSPVPAYEQLRRQVSAMVVAGTLQVGDRLPPIRRLAGDLDLAPGTVARAYRELESAGLVRTAGRRGTQVAPQDAWAQGTDMAASLEQAATDFATTVQQLGADEDQAVAAVRAALAPQSRRDRNPDQP